MSIKINYSSSDKLKIDFCRKKFTIVTSKRPHVSQKPLNWNQLKKFNKLAFRIFKFVQFLDQHKPQKSSVAAPSFDENIKEITWIPSNM